MNRHREKVTKNLVENYVHYRNGSVYRTTPTLVEYEHWSMDDVVTPGYRRRIARGEIINNPCTLTVTRQRAGGGYSYAKATSGSTVYTSQGRPGSLTLASGGPFGTFSADGLNLDALKQSAMQDCLGRVDAPEYSLAADIGEIRETLTTLRDPLRGLRTVLGSFDSRWKSLLLSKRKRFPFKSIASLRAAALAEAWLEFRYGISPLFWSAETILSSYYDKVLDNQLPIRTIRSNRSGSGRSARSSFVVAPHNYVFERYHEAQAEVKATIRYKVVKPSHPYLARYGLRVKDIPRALWDLKPLSFMVDRCFHIGNAISGLVALSDPSIVILAGCVTSKVTQTSTVRITAQNSAGYNPLIVNGDPAVREVFTYSRVPWNPTAKDTIPAFLPGNLVSSAKNQADLVSLFALVLLGRTSRNASVTMGQVTL